MISRFLACFLSFSLLISSVPPEVFSQMRGAPQPGAGGFLPGRTFSSGLELYRWMSSFPEFSRNPAFSAQVLIQAAPLIQKGPVKASLEGNRIVLASDRSDFEPLYIELPGTGGPVSQSAALLARELERAQGTDKKEGGVSHSSRVLSRFFESFSRPAPESGALPVKASVSEGSSLAPATSRLDIWLNLEDWIQKGLELKVSGKTEQWKKATVEILRNNPSLPLEKALSMGFARTYALSPETGRKIEFFIANQGMTQELKSADSRSVNLIGNALYVDTVKGLYKLNGGKAVPVLTDVGQVHEITRIGDVVYVRAERGLYRLKREGDRPVRVLTGVGRVHEITRIGDVVYLGAEKGLYKLKGNKAVPVLTKAGSVYAITRIGDVVYVRAERGLYRLKREREGDRPVRVLTGQVGITRIGDVVYLGAEKGLYELKGNKAVPVLTKAGWVLAIKRIGDVVYVGTEKGLYRLKREGDRPVRVLTGSVYEITQVGDVVYVGAERGLYKLKGNKAVPVLTKAGWVDEITRIREAVYVRAERGLYRLKGDKAVPVLTGAGRVHEITRIGEAAYVRADDGLYELKGDRAVPVLEGAGIRQIRAWDAKAYISTKNGFFTWLPPPGNLKSWKQSVLEEVSKTIGQMQKSPGPASPTEPLKTDQSGSILGEDGRTLFSGLKAFAFVTGLLGAGALEGLSRLAMSLGSLSLGWIEESMEVASGKDIPEADLPPPAPKDFQGDVWPVLEEKIGKELQLKLLSGGTQEWKKEAARTLRNEPGLELYEALARSFAKAHRLDESTAKKARSFLEELGSRVAEGEFLLELQMEPHRIYGLAELNGKTYLKTEEGLLAREEGRWNRETPEEMGQAMEAEFLDGRLYAADLRGGWVKEGNRWELSLDCGVVHRLRVIGGRLYAASVSGLWALERGRWVLVLPGKGLFGVGWVHDAAELDGKLYAAGDSGVYVLEEKSPLRRLLGRFFSRRARWKRELKTSIFSLVRTDGTLYALGHRGLYGKSGGGWERELGYVSDVVKFNGTLYAGGFKGLHAKEGNGAPHPAGWTWPYPGIGQVKRFSVVQGRLYAQTQNGLYMKQGGDWARVKAKSEISSIEEADGEIYLKTEEGLGRWVPDRRVPANWQKPVLQDVEEEIGRLHGSAEARPRKEPPPADEDGSIRGEDGRTLFNGFQGSKG